MNLSLILAPFVAFVITLLLIPSIIEIANKKQLFDLPGHRKLHTTPIPALGGLAIFVGFLLAIICFSGMAGWLEIRFIVASGLLLMLIGLKDDLVEVSARKKFLLQLFLGTILYMNGFRLEGLYGLFQIDYLPIFLSLPLTVLAIVLIINAFNLIDGVNGLSGSLGVMSSLVFGGLFLQAGLIQWSLMAFVMGGALLGFLKFNFGKAKVFMGDNGSTFMGLMMSVFFIKYLNTAYFQLNNSHALVLSLCIIFIPLFDVTRVFASRLMQGRSPFSPDKSHIHHVLVRLGRTHSKICVLLVLFNLGLIFLAAQYLSTFSIMVSIVIVLMLFAALMILMSISEGLTKIKQDEKERQRIGVLI